MKPLLDDDPIARITEPPVGHHFIDRQMRRRRVGTHRHTFARGQTICLDDTGTCQGIDIVMRRVPGVENGIGRGGDLVPLHEILGEGLAAFELCRGRRGAEGRDPHFSQTICDPGGERIFGADHDQVDLLLLSKCQDASQIGRLRFRMARREFGDRCAPRCHMQRGQLGALRDLPDQRMLAPAAANDQDLQGLSSFTEMKCRKRSVGIKGRNRISRISDGSGAHRSAAWESPAGLRPQ